MTSFPPISVGAIVTGTASAGYVGGCVAYISWLMFTDLLLFISLMLLIMVLIDIYFTERRCNRSLKRLRQRKGGICGAVRGGIA